jgi:hypothetical protein
MQMRALLDSTVAWDKGKIANLRAVVPGYP